MRERSECATARTPGASFVHGDAARGQLGQSGFEGIGPVERSETGPIHHIQMETLVTAKVPTIKCERSGVEPKG